MKIKYLPIVSAVFLILVMTLQFVVSYRWESKRVHDNIDYEFQLAQKDFIFLLYDIQDAGKDMQHYVSTHLSSPDRIERQTDITLRRCPYILACYVGFTPGYYHPEDYWYCPYAYRHGDSIVCTMYGDAEHDYFQAEWYQDALSSESGNYWTPFYRDEGIDELIFTHSVRVEQDDRPVCIIGLDFSMEWVYAMLERIKPYPDAWCKLYNSSDGTLILESGYTGETENSRNMIVRSSTLTPMDIRLEIGVPTRHVLESIRNKSLITLAVLLLCITIAGWLIRRIWHDQESYARVETENKVMENELRIASGIQMGILRGSTMDGSTTYVGRDAGYILEAGLTPMREVGGDLYDFYRKDDDLYFIIGDVSGKSVPAAMFMSATVNLFRSAVRRLPSPKAIMEDMNSVLSDNNPSMMFVTAFIGRLHIPTGALLYCNAGHCAPLIKEPSDQVPGTKVVEVVPNIPLGYDGRFRFEEQGMLLGEGETLVLYTDGITEARNEKHEMLGLKRWREIVERVISSNDTDNLRAIGEAGMRFIGKAEQTDDLTVMCISKRDEAEPMRIRVENRQDQWPVLKNALHNYGLCAGTDKRALKKLEVALEEVVVNIIHYSQAEWIKVQIDKVQSANESLCVTITDNGVAFDPTDEINRRLRADNHQTEGTLKNENGEWRVGGLGISLIRQIADEIHYRRVNGENELTIIKYN